MTHRQPTQEQIIERIHARAPEDPLRYEVTIYTAFLELEHAKPFYPPASDLSTWTVHPWSEQDLLWRIGTHLRTAFARAKTRDEMATIWSLQSFIAWTWLLGDEELSEQIRTMPFDGYGKPAFRKVAEHYGIDLSDCEGHDEPDEAMDAVKDSELEQTVMFGPQRKAMPDSIDAIIDAAWEEATQKKDTLS